MSNIEIQLKVNGEIYEVCVKPYWTLLYVLRNELGLTGTKYCCGSGECGACTVIMDRKAVPSCLVLAMNARDSEIITIEGLAKEGKLNPIQQAFIEHEAIQCGFCTPGMIMSAKALLDANPKPTENEVREAMKGNLCRCTGYVNIVKAILSLAQKNV